MMQPLSPEVLVYHLRTAADPQIAPDGGRVVYSLNGIDVDTKRTSAALWLIDNDGGRPRRLTWNGRQQSWPRWSPDGTMLAFVSDRVPENGVFVLPIDGPGEAREVTRHRQSISGLAWSPDGKQIAYTVPVDPANVGEDAPPADAAPQVRVTRRIDYKQDNRGYLGDVRLQVFVVDVENGTRRQLTTEAVDHNAPQWSPDGQWLAVQIPNHNGMFSQLGLVEVASGGTTLVGPVIGTVSVWAWSPDGERILFAGDPEHSPQPDFFVYTVATGTMQRLTTTLDCLPDGGFATISAPAQPLWLDNRRALFHGFGGGRSGLYQLDVAQGQIARIARWEALHSGLSADQERRFFVQSGSSFGSTGEVAIFDRQADASAVITTMNAEVLREHPPAAWERVELKRGEYVIQGWLLKPPGLDPAKPYPVVLDVHGGPHDYYGHGFNAVQQCLATNGFLVVCVNPRGSGSYGREFAQQVLRDWGGEDFQDLMVVLDHVLERPYADAERTGIYGYSYGGFMTSWTIGHTDRFRAAVVGAPVFDLESFYGTSDIGHVFGDMQFGTAPWQDEAWFRAHSPSTFAHRATTPTLIVHGEDDQRCPIGQGEQLFIALLKAGVEVEFVRYPGGSHMMLRNGPAEHRADFLTRVLGWFKKHLGEPA